MMKPTIGSKVKVKMSFTQGPLMIPPRDNFITFEGTVLPSQKWMNTNQFCLSGDSIWPVRVLNLSLVEQIDLIEGELVETDQSTKTWIVPGSKGNQYTVIRNAGKYQCTCSGFGFRKTCKHIKEIDND